MRLANDIKTKRRVALALEQPRLSVPTLSDKGLTEAKRRRGLEGGMVILVFGRAVLKGNKAVLRHRWTESYQGPPLEQ